MGAGEGREEDQARGDIDAARAHQSAAVRAVLRLVPREPVPAAQEAGGRQRTARAGLPVSHYSHFI